MQVTRLIPDARGTNCDKEMEPILNTTHSHILRVPFRTDEGGILQQWVSRFDIYPYLERFSQVSTVRRTCLAELVSYVASSIGSYIILNQSGRGARRMLLPRLLR